MRLDPHPRLSSLINLQSDQRRDEEQGASSIALETYRRRKVVMRIKTHKFVLSIDLLKMV